MTSTLADPSRSAPAQAASCRKAETVQRRSRAPAAGRTPAVAAAARSPAAVSAEVMAVLASFGMED